jgi:hypothetical protein
MYEYLVVGCCYTCIYVNYGTVYALQLTPELDHWEVDHLWTYIVCIYNVHCNVHSLSIVVEQLPAGKKPSGQIKMACKWYGWIRSEASRRRVTVTSSLNAMSTDPLVKRKGVRGTGPRLPHPLPLRVAKTGKNHLNEEIAPLLPAGIGERFSQTISNLGHAAILRWCELPLKTKVLN